MTAAAAAPHIAALTLRYFRSHAQFEHRAAPGLILLVGPNGVGKTNILEAIAALAPGRGLRGASADEMAMRGAEIGWAVAAELVVGDAARRLEARWDAGAARRSAKLDGEAASSAEIAGLLRLLWLTPAMDRLWIEGAAERRRYLDRLTLAFEPGHAERSAAYERAMRERNRLLKEPRRPPSAWFDALEARMAVAAAAIAAARAATLAALAAADARPDRPDAGAFPSADLALIGPMEAEQPLTADAVAERFATDRAGDIAAGRTRFGPHRSDLAATYRAKAAPAAQCSTGEQKALLLSLTLTAAAALRAQSGAAPILLLDEVAAHLDPARRGALFDALHEMGAQAWLTGAQASDFAALEGRATQITLGA